MPAKKTVSRPQPDLASNGMHPDQFLEEGMALAKANVNRCLDDVVAETQRNPLRSLMWALGAGYLLRLLPTTRVLGGLVRLFLILVKPAALIYGLSKLWKIQRIN